MATYRLTGITKADITKDRAQFDIVLQSREGALTLQVSAEHLDHLITCLVGLDYHASLLDPSKGQKPGESAQIRSEIVDKHSSMTGEVNGAPAVFLGFQIAKIIRWFALNSQLAEQVRDTLTAEIPNLKKSARPN